MTASQAPAVVYVLDGSGSVTPKQLRDFCARVDSDQRDRAVILACRNMMRTTEVPAGTPAAPWILTGHQGCGDGIREALVHASSTYPSTEIVLLADEWADFSALAVLFRDSPFAALHIPPVPAQVGHLTPHEPETRNDGKL